MTKKHNFKIWKSITIGTKTKDQLFKEIKKMWNKLPIGSNYESIPWLSPMKLTEEGRKSFPALIGKKAVFVGFSRERPKRGLYKILVENVSSPYVYSRNFWEPI